jgi:hypothetical protein
MSPGDNNILRTIPQEKDYPLDPNTIPVPPSSQQPRPQVTLSELIPGKYVSTTARVVYLKTIERHDALGSKMLFSGILEDSSFKVPFISHRISYPLIRNSVYKFNSVYVYEFSSSDKSLLLVITEHTKIDSKNIEDYREFIWSPKIESIKRPVRNLTLQGLITTVHSNSGLVKRCNKCKSIIYDSCPNKCPQEEGWGWDLRVSSRLYDGSGSIKMVLTKDIASKVLRMNLAELILLATTTPQSNVPAQSYSDGQHHHQFQPPSVFTIKVPDIIDIIEAVTENNILSSSYRSSEKLIVTDGRNLVYFPPNEENEQKFSESVKRPLKTFDVEDKKIIKRLVEKAVDINIRKATGKRMMQGIYLLEEPISLYRCERAKLYLGFSVKLNIKEKEKEQQDNSGTVTTTTTTAVIETTPQAYVRESVLDYIKMRRERGASANAIVRNLLTYRNKVVVAPSGNYCSIVDVIIRKAETQLVSDNDKRNLIDFWKQIYNIDISADEIPLLKVKMMNSENTFTYPPSMCFFGSESLLIQADVQKFIESKKSTLKARMDDVIKKAIVTQDLTIGLAELEFEEEQNGSQGQRQPGDIQSHILQEIRQKLFGRNVTSRGSIMFVHDELWFFPYQLQLS